MGELAALTAAALWAFASMLFTNLSRDYGPIVMNALKCVLALAMMALTLLILEGEVWPSGLSQIDLIALAASGLIGLSIGDTAYFNALIRIGARRALLLSALTPPTTALLAWPVLGEDVNAKMLIGMGLTLAGVVWVILERTTEEDATDDERREASRTLFVGVLFGLVAVLCQSTGNVLTKFGGDQISAIAISVVRVMIGSMGLLVIVGARGRMRELVAPFREARPAALLIVATFAGTYLGIWMLNAGLKYTSHTGIAATLSSTSPIFILPLAWLVLGERLSVRAVAGAFVAVCGVALLFLA